MKTQSHESEPNRDLASATLFCLILLIILHEIFDGLEYGIKIGSYDMTDKGYADDVGLMTEMIKQMNIALGRLHLAGKKCGLAINIKKTKVMCMGDHTVEDGTIPDVFINNTVIENVKKFEYLGHILTNTSDDLPAVKASP